jgi:hypothetical protein
MTHAAAQSLSNLRAAVGGGADAGITSPAANGQLYVPYVTNDYASVLVPTDANSLAYARTPTQVLNIVYGGSETKPGARMHACPLRRLILCRSICHAACMHPCSPPLPATVQK